MPALARRVLWLHGMVTRVRSLGWMVVLGAMAASGCVGSDDLYGDGDGDGTPYSALAVDELTIRGHVCPTRGEIAGRNIPADNLYYITTFGGGRDNQPMACGTYADGRWLYIADSWRFGCRARVRVTHPQTGRWCVAEVADVGPNICVERAAGKPIIDASPVITRELFGRSSAGWSDRMVVHTTVVPRSTPLGCGSGTPPPAGTQPQPPAQPPPSTPPASTATCFSGTYNRSMAFGTCLQSRFDDLWYQCTAIGWVQSSSIAGQRRGTVGSCTQYLPR